MRLQIVLKFSPVLRYPKILPVSFRFCPYGLAVVSLNGLQDQDMQQSVCSVGSQLVFDLSQVTVFPMKRLTRVINPVPPNNILLREFCIKIKSNWKNKTLPNNILKGSRLQVIHNYLAPLNENLWNI